MTNFNNIKFEEIRRSLDPKYVKLFEKLDDCYYNNWAQRKSFPFTMDGKAYDVGINGEASKETFDKLQGAINHQYEVDLYNSATAVNEKYRPNSKDLTTLLRRKNESQAKLDLLSDDSITVEIPPISEKERQEIGGSVPVDLI